MGAACQLVMQSSAMGKGGESFMFDMSTPMKSVDLARDLIRLSGFSEGEFPIQFSGVRPVEKLFAELGFDAEKMDKTRHPKVFIGRLGECSVVKADAALRHLAGYTGSTSAVEVRAALALVVPEMQDDATEAPPAVVRKLERKSKPGHATAPTPAPV
jgi:FlaA1/EpsC-like NDP-sugar epimerase